MVHHISPIDTATASLGVGKPVVILVKDKEGRVSYGELVFAAERVTPSLMSFVVENTTGFITTPMTHRDLARLDIPPMIAGNPKWGDHVAVDATDGIGTGISASDRARTLHVLSSPRSTAADLRRPGHVIPQAAHADGVLGHGGVVEASVDLLQLAGLRPVAGCATLADSQTGDIVTGDNVTAWAGTHKLATVTVDDVIVGRRQGELLKATADSRPLRGRFREFEMRVFSARDEGDGHVALVYEGGQSSRVSRPVVYLHSGCVIGELLGNSVCCCSAALESALEAIVVRGRGVAICIRGDPQDYLHQSSEVQQLPTGYPYWIAAQMLRKCQINAGDLLHGDWKTAEQLRRYGIVLNDAAAA